MIIDNLIEYAVLLSVNFSGTVIRLHLLVFLDSQLAGKILSEDTLGFEACLSFGFYSSK